MSAELVNRLVLTAEACGTNLTDGAAALIASELATYDQAQVAGALRKCMRELKGRLTLAVILEKLDDGRPGPEEAWAMIPLDEAASVVWTEEMAEAFGIVGPLLADGDRIAARMAFREAYTRLLSVSRDARKPVRWTPSLGHDPRGRDAVVQDAVRLGRLSARQAGAIGYSGPVSQDMMALVYGETPMVAP